MGKREPRFTKTYTTSKIVKLKTILANKQV